MLISSIILDWFLMGRSRFYIVIYDCQTSFSLLSLSPQLLQSIVVIIHTKSLQSPIFKGTRKGVKEPGMCSFLNKSTQLLGISLKLNWPTCSHISKCLHTSSHSILDITSLKIASRKNAQDISTSAFLFVMSSRHSRYF